MAPGANKENKTDNVTMSLAVLNAGNAHTFQGKVRILFTSVETIPTKNGPFQKLVGRMVQICNEDEEQKFMIQFEIAESKRDKNLLQLRQQYAPGTALQISAPCRVRLVKEGLAKQKDNTKSRR